ncbi:MAG: sulfite exporter TauE/SafE family protein [Oscillospiraceae bacterium]|nr:sulfite exporter TauE/SafE family protein [Oscillospiraceae bacterium]
MKNIHKVIIGGISGVLNGLFGSGGGVAAVPLLTRFGVEPRKSHATSVAIIFVLSLVSTGLYALNGILDVSMAMSFIPAGLAGAVVGAVFLKKIPNSLLRRVFGIVILISAVRMLVA